MTLERLLKDNNDYIRTKGRFRVLLTKQDRKEGITWYCTLSIAPSDAAKRFEKHLLDANLREEFVDTIMRKWEADVGNDGPSMITFRVYAPEDYVI